MDSQTFYPVSQSINWETEVGYVGTDSFMLEYTKFVEYLNETPARPLGCRAKPLGRKQIGMPSHAI